MANALNALYDYKRNKYEILQQSEDRYYLLTAAEKYYIVDLKDISTKPLKSVFNRGAEKQYDIEAQLKPLTETIARQNWNELQVSLGLSGVLEKEKVFDKAQSENIEHYSQSALTELLKNKKNLSQTLTIGLVENLDKSKFYSGIKAEQSMATARLIFDYMKKNQIQLHSDNRLLGNCDNLKLEKLSFEDIYKKSVSYNEQRQEHIMAANKRKAQNYFDSNDVKLYVPDKNVSHELQNSVVLYSENGIEICADRYKDKTSGVTQYEITVNSKYKFFTSDRQIIGKCHEKDLCRISQAVADDPKNMLGWDNIKEPMVEKDKIKHNIKENVASR